jgi:hypothetical protein
MEPEEKKPAPSPKESKVDDYQEKMRKSLDPPLDEIYSGKSLNDLLSEAQDLLAMQAPGSKVRLGKDVLKYINVISDKDTGSVGIFKDQGRLGWPPALRESAFETHRESLNSLVPKAIQQAARGRVDSDLLKETHATVARIDDQLAKEKQNPTSEVANLPPADYIKAKRFLAHVKEGLNVLAQPDAENYFNGRYSPKGQTVADLIAHMTKEGLRFAPAEAGDETGYKNLHRALAVYVVAAHNAPQTEE